jgi:uncharacterized protein with FMN-binding domain
MKTFLKIIGIIALIIVIAIGGFAIYMNNGMSAAKAIQIGTVNPSALADGSYEGSYNGGRFTNEVQVTVKSGKIENIQTEKTVTFEKQETTKALFDSVVARQNTDVDVQSGATLTSKAYLKSIENALSNK